MGDHFVLLVDRLLTESTLAAAIESRNHSIEAPSLSSSKFSEIIIDESFVEKGVGKKLGECRICQDEDEESNMETPCSCRGSLKYAHRRCVQRWCNEKGNTLCEICHQQFMPGYTAPPPLFRFGHIPMNFRGNWEISRRNLNSPRFIAMVSTDHNFLQRDYDDYSASTSSSLLRCRLVAIIFMVLLILRHTLPLIFSEDNDYTVPLFLLIFLRTAGIVLPIYIIVRAVTLIQRRPHHEPPSSPMRLSDEAESSERQPQPLIVRVH